MRILVSGGAGFIGSHFVKKVLETRPDDEVLVLDALTYAGNPENLDETCRDDPRFTFWHGNVCNADLVSELVRDSDIVVHLAAESHVARSIYDNSLFFTTDVIGTQTIANAVARSDRVKLFLHVSTSEVYGTARAEPIDEEHPLEPLSPYAGAKAGADRLVFSYRAAYDIPAVILRPFNTYGPNQHLEKVIPRFITSAIDGEPLTIHGTGEAKRDWLFVDDTVSAIARLLDHRPAAGPCEVFNVATGASVRVVDIARKICAATGQSDDLITHIGDRPGQVTSQRGDASRFQDRFGWRPDVAFDEGLARTVAWYLEHEAWWRRHVGMKVVPVRTASGKIEYH